MACQQIDHAGLIAKLSSAKVYMMLVMPVVNLLGPDRMTMISETSPG
jgi:hypothetical protein